MHFVFYWCPMFRSETCCQFECSSGDSAFVCLSFSGLGLRLLFCPLCFSRYCRSRFNTSWQKFVPDRSLSHPRIWWLYGCRKMDFRGQGPQFNAGRGMGPYVFHALRLACYRFTKIQSPRAREKQLGSVGNLEGGNFEHRCTVVWLFSIKNQDMSTCLKVLITSKPIPTSRSSRFLRYVSIFYFWGVAAYGKGRTVCYEHHA